VARGTAGGSVEERAGGIERDGRGRRLAAAAAPGAGGRDRIGGTQGIAVSVVERDRIAGEAGVGGDDGDDTAGEEALVELPDAAVESTVPSLRTRRRRWIVSAAASAGSSTARQVAPAQASAGAWPIRPPCDARW